MALQDLPWRTLIRFPRARYWVDPRAVKAYVTWSWQRAQREGRSVLRSFLRCLWHPTLATGIPLVVADALRVARGLGVGANWIRYPSDGTRLQIFDANQRQICKVLLPDACHKTYDYELEVRRRVGELAPPIVAVSPSDHAYVEQWIVDARPLCSTDLFFRALHGLQRSLYHIEWIRADQFLAKLAEWGPVSRAIMGVVDCAFSKIGGGIGVPWSMVHGDFVQPNVLVGPRGQPVLIDWEYARECIVSYDYWLYRYDHERKHGDLNTNVFHGEPRRILNELYGSSVAEMNPLALHMLHLAERTHYLAHISPNTTRTIRQTMDQDMRNACAQLTSRSEHL
jgi:hypothetical protein